MTDEAKHEGDRGGERATAPPPWALSLLAEGRVAHLATADAEGRPSVVAVCYVLDDDDDPGVVYTAVDGKPKATRRLRRVRNLEENPEVSVLVDRWDEDWTQLRWVSVRGRGSVLDGEGGAHEPEREAALGALRAKYPQYVDEDGDAGPGRAVLGDDAPVIRVEIDRLRGWRFARQPGDETEE